VRIISKQVSGGCQHTGSADTTLRASGFSKRLLQWMQITALREFFHCADRRAFDLEHRHQAAVDELVVHEN
jgi:hypothetical protein